MFSNFDFYHHLSTFFLHLYLVPTYLSFILLLQFSTVEREITRWNEAASMMMQTLYQTVLGKVIFSIEKSGLGRMSRFTRWGQGGRIKRVQQYGVRVERSELRQFEDLFRMSPTPPCRGTVPNPKGGGDPWMNPEHMGKILWDPLKMIQGRRTP